MEPEKLKKEYERLLNADFVWRNKYAMLQDDLARAWTDRDKWKSSYYAIHKHIGKMLDFYSRWKGVHQGWNQTMRTKRDRESYRLIKEIVESRNNKF